ncbi:histone deacetylase [Nocardia bovistercoris]|uniref:Histone deacetylase n=1 Tax=Nocardia bovistercoris TaxID=2785916 RepID=A0A931N0N3_9NOCA|nr:histone deacetylase [Nocardia bovistercoris]MBH0775159.1 histone deacetylase [Nocardia bovistercoris]
MTDLVWYASYGSNMHSARFACYLAGGTPEGGAIDLPGCRDRTAPRRTRALALPGLLYFATESRTWTGGRAFYTPEAAGVTAARAYLVTAEQFGDIVAQEMYRTPDAHLDLTAAVSAGHAAIGPGRYETLIRTGTLDGHPMLTCTAPREYTALPGNPPSPAYLRHLAAGLRESHDWPLPRIAEYLATRPGANLRWTPRSVLTAVTAHPDR